MPVRNITFAPEPTPGLPAEEVYAAPASATAPGVVRQAAAVADLTAAPTQADFNGLLAVLRAAGILAATE